METKEQTVMYINGVGAVPKINVELNFVSIIKNLLIIVILLLGLPS